MSSSSWRDGRIRELLTIMGEKVMQSHLTKTLEDGEIYEKDSERNVPLCQAVAEPAWRCKKA